MVFCPAPAPDPASAPALKCWRRQRRLSAPEPHCSQFCREIIEGWWVMVVHRSGTCSKTQDLETLSLSAAVLLGKSPVEDEGFVALSDWPTRRELDNRLEAKFFVNVLETPGCPRSYNGSRHPGRPDLHTESFAGFCRSSWRLGPVLSSNNLLLVLGHGGLCVHLWPSLMAAAPCVMGLWAPCTCPAEATGSRGSTGCATSSQFGAMPPAWLPKSMEKRGGGRSL